MEKHKGIDSDGDDILKLKKRVLELEDENKTFRKMLSSYEKSFEKVRSEIISGEKIIEALENLQELSREELIVALEEANSKGQLVEIKNAFVSNISHELRTPLTLAMAPLELLLEGELGVLSPQQFAHIEIVYSNAKRLLKLVDELLDLAKIDAGKMEPVYIKEDFNAFSRAIFEHFIPYSDQLGVTYINDLPENQINVFFDSDKIEKVIGNLIVNSIKYSAGIKKVRVYIEETEKEVFFKVNNTGPAIEPKLLNKVFERFQRLENAKKERIIGSGLGLALSKELVKLHKGNIGITSNDKDGTTVWFSLLKGSCHLTEEQKKLGWGRLERRRGQRPERISDGASALSKEINGFYDFDSKMLEELVYDTVYDNKVKVFNLEKTILIADDNKEMLGFLNFVLGRYFKILTASNGEEALEIARLNKPDLILSDIMMPVMDGYELCRNIKSDDKLKSIPVILLTAKTKNVYEKIKGLEIGADDYLSKPMPFLE
jgi:signal transduction histidine kinase